MLLIFFYNFPDHYVVLSLLSFIIMIRIFKKKIISKGSLVFSRNCLFVLATFSFVCIIIMDCSEDAIVFLEQYLFHLLILFLPQE